MKPLDLSLPTATDVTFTRDFAAPRPLVWRAMTEAALIPTWLYANGIPMIACRQDFRTGGSFRWVWQRPNLPEMGVSGRFLDIAAPGRMVHTELFDEDWTGGETTVTTLLTEVSPALTRMQMTVRYSSQAARDKALSSGMTQGMEEAFFRLDAAWPQIAAAAH
jgi:uncharacterized protein YndB with AHSA1/START domain